MLINIKEIEKFVKELKKALNSNDIETAKYYINRLSSRRVARELTSVPPKNIGKILKSIDPIKASRIAGYLPFEKLNAVIDSVPSKQSISLLSKIPSDQIGPFLRSLSEKKRQKLFDKVDPLKKKEWKVIHQYSEETVGANMSTEFLVISSEATVGKALKAISSSPPEVEKSTYIYIIDNHKKLLGVASVRDLIRFSQSEKISKIMIKDIIAVKTSDLTIDAAKILRNRRFAMLPVIDQKNKLLGVFTLDDAADALAINVADQFKGITGDDTDESFFTRPKGAIKKRLPWMASNVLLNLIAVAIISSFENTIAQVAILAAFLPMITDMGGNVGIQSMSVAIRSIALGEAQVRDINKAMKKELMVGIFNGIALGSLFGLIALGLRGNWILGLVAGTALGINVIVAGVVGGCMPFIIKRLGKDPAMMTGPILTTITDITGITIYLGLSTLFLAGLI